MQVYVWVTQLCRKRLHEICRIGVMGKRLVVYTYSKRLVETLSCTPIRRDVSCTPIRRDFSWQVSFTCLDKVSFTYSTYSMSHERHVSFTYGNAIFHEICRMGVFFVCFVWSCVPVRVSPALGTRTGMRYLVCFEACRNSRRQFAELQ